MEDSFTSQLDVVAINKYMGWYHPWPVEPKNAIWEVVTDKPLIISEFGGEALYGQSGDENVVSSWSEEYQARLYRDNIRMFDNIPNLRGVSPGFCSTSVRRSVSTPPIKMAGTAKDSYPTRVCVRKRGI